MKKTILIALGILLLTAALSTPEAQQQKKIAILPFSVNSACIMPRFILGVLANHREINLV